jgi:hypothetical protein
MQFTPEIQSAPDAPQSMGVEPKSPALSVLEHRVIEELRAQSAPLFAILDAARDPLVLARLLQCEEEYRSLYEGPKAGQLVDVAPYLVALPAQTPFLETLVRDGWGQSWGVYLTSDRPFHEVRKHLRRFLTVETEDGKKLLFRFYDPRVLRVYLPTCTHAEAREFFGPIKFYLMEAGDPECLLAFDAARPVTPPHVVSLSERAPIEEGRP